MVREIYASSKVRISVEEKEKDNKVFRILVDHNGRNIHANISSNEAAKISEAIYQNLPEELIEQIESGEFQEAN